MKYVLTHDEIHKALYAYIESSEGSNLTPDCGVFKCDGESPNGCTMEFEATKYEG